VVGIDLAWGRRAPSGLCAVAADGAVTASATVVSDDEIVSWMGEWAPEPAVVGFDAPLVVNNLAGRRECEALVSRAFGPEKAGVYPSNRSMAAFADGGRAFHLSRRLGLALDPVSAAERGCGLAVEVFPHSALVALFGLEVRLAYKSGRGRSVDARREEMGRLASLVVALSGVGPGLRAEVGPQWSALFHVIPNSTRHVDLDRVEDELDAHVCAFVARLLAADLADGGSRVRVLGEWSEGAVVTPVDERHVGRLGQG